MSGFNTYQATVMIKSPNGISNTAHQVRINADSVFSASQMLKAQYGSNNVISVPTEIQTNNSNSHNAAPWML